MNSKSKASIACIDDNQDILSLVERILSTEGYITITSTNPREGIELIREQKPDLILLDISIPEMDGYEVCSILQDDSETSHIPVIFATARESDQDKAKAFSVGGVDYIVKPLTRDTLLSKIESHLETLDRWRRLNRESSDLEKKVPPADFVRFKEFLSTTLNITREKKEELLKITPQMLYSFAAELGINNRKMAEFITGFLGLPYTDSIKIGNVELGALPKPYCTKNLVVPCIEPSGEKSLIVSNPFDWELMQLLEGFLNIDPYSRLIVTEPDNIKKLFETASDMTLPPSGASIPKSVKTGQKTENPRIAIYQYQTEEEEKTTEKEDPANVDGPAVIIADSILSEAIKERASDVHIEPKKDMAVVRFRIDGDMKDELTLKKKTTMMVIARLKTLAGLDIAERRKPQDGSLARDMGDGLYNFRLATSSTPYGESVVIRILKPYAKPKTLQELGMSEKQAEILIDCGNQSFGLILFVGGTGSGKSTSVYSLFSQIDCATRSLMSVEDPVEYRIPFANQQQVNEKAGITFNELLKSSVRQDPDILYLGEIRDQFSAKTALDFSSTGHLTISTLHTPNATSAIFRLERLGVNRDEMAESLLCVVAQKLLKKTCVDCREIVPISEEEKEMLAHFTDKIPQTVAQARGCPECNFSGYYGRDGVYEVIMFDPEIATLLRSGTPIADIRSTVLQRGHATMSDHAIEKLRSHTFTPKDIYNKILVEEGDRRAQTKHKKTVRTVEAPAPPDGVKSILIVEDDEDSRNLIVRILRNEGYHVNSSEDGADALFSLGKEEFDLIISDIQMPNLDGLTLIEMIKHKGIETPVIFLTSLTNEEDEIKGLKKGAIDYIKKPIKKELLILRVKKYLESYCLEK